ncbi:MAG: LysM peptidoglycan-binding domain-containing protein [Chloroflexi bacterium]|nr:LysM peptidoglycan-binding domain-containing protein [Chloroflexota bacterium]
MNGPNGDRRLDDVEPGARELPEGLELVDESLRSHAQENAPQVPPGLLDRAYAVIDREPRPTPARSFARAVASRSWTDMVASYRATLRSAFEPDVPLMVRLQSIALAVVVALFLAAGVTVAATGASEVIRFVSGTPEQPPEHELLDISPSPSSPTLTGSPASAFPDASSSASHDASPSASETLYVVVEGETLSEIAERYGVTVEALVEANDIADPDLLEIGQRLVIPQRPGASASPVPDASPSPGGSP